MKSSTILAAFAAGTAAMPAGLHARADTSSCPYYLPEGGYEFPHLIVPINNSNIAVGHSYFASVSPNNCATIFNFDIPASRANQQCSLYFTFPGHDQLETSDFQWTGNNAGTEPPGTQALGTLTVQQYQYNTGATDATTGNSQPPIGPDPIITLQKVRPGNVYKPWTGNCGPGGVMSWKLSSPDSWLAYFQDWNVCAIGIWIVYEAAPPAKTEDQCGKCPSMSKFRSHTAWLEAYTGSSEGVAMAM